MISEFSTYSEGRNISAKNHFNQIPISDFEL